MEQLIGTVVGASIALTGVVANAWWTRRAAREDRAEVDAKEQQIAEAGFVAAKRLVLTDLQRAADRLEITTDRPEARAHWLELPRGAWKEHRTLLANRLDRDVWWALAEAYNQVTDWNDLVSASLEDPAQLDELRARHPIVSGMVMRAIDPLARDVADDLARQRSFEYSVARSDAAPS